MSSEDGHIEQWRNHLKIDSCLNLIHFDSHWAENKTYIFQRNANCQQLCLKCGFCLIHWSSSRKHQTIGSWEATFIGHTEKKSENISLTTEGKHAPHTLSCMLCWHISAPIWFPLPFNVLFPFIISDQRHFYHCLRKPELYWNKGIFHIIFVLSWPGSLTVELVQ